MKELFLKQRNMWLPRWWLILAVLFVCILLTIIGIKNAAFYLALTEPKYGNCLVVEGWQNENSLKKALAVFAAKDNNYLSLITRVALTLDN